MRLRKLLTQFIIVMTLQSCVASRRHHAQSSEIIKSGYYVCDIPGIRKIQLWIDVKEMSFSIEDSYVNFPPTEGSGSVIMTDDTLTLRFSENGQDLDDDSKEHFIAGNLILDVKDHEIYLYDDCKFILKEHDMSDF